MGHARDQPNHFSLPSPNFASSSCRVRQETLQPDTDLTLVNLGLNIAEGLERRDYSARAQNLQKYTANAPRNSLGPSQVTKRKTIPSTLFDDLCDPLHHKGPTITSDPLLRPRLSLK